MPFDHNNNYIHENAYAFRNPDRGNPRWARGMHPRAGNSSRNTRRLRRRNFQDKVLHTAAVQRSLSFESQRYPLVLNFTEVIPELAFIPGLDNASQVVRVWLANPLCLPFNRPIYFVVAELRQRHFLAWYGFRPAAGATPVLFPVLPQRFAAAGKSREDALARLAGRRWFTFWGRSLSLYDLYKSVTRTNPQDAADTLTSSVFFQFPETPRWRIPSRNLRVIAAQPGQGGKFVFALTKPNSSTNL
jgi:hypothetical protein